MKQKILLITSIACFFLASASSFAQSSNVWTGGSSTSGNWSDPANWGGSAPASPQAILNFAGSVRTSSTNDFASGSAGYRIFFKSGAGSFTLRGNSINFFDYSGTDSKIENDSSSGQTLAIDITAASFFVPQLEMNPVNGNITNLNPLSLWGSNQLQIWGNNGKIIVFGPGSVINNLGSVAINQNSVVIFQATNTYSGDTYVNAGTLRLATNDATINSIIRLGDLGGTATANLNLDGGLVLTSVINPRLGSSGTKTLANTAGTSGNATYAGNLYLDDNVTVYANSGGGVTLAGSVIDLRGSTLLVDGPAATTALTQK